MEALAEAQMVEAQMEEAASAVAETEVGAEEEAEMEAQMAGDWVAWAAQTAHTRFYLGVAFRT